MEAIGRKIRVLRKNKGLTQEISKWENQQSVPDIDLLPMIARYFGITMDELFNYRLDALNYKERFIRFMSDNGVLKFGEFELQSGRKSPYYIDTNNYKSAAQITKLGEFYAECIRENNIQTQVLYGNTGREVPLMISTSMILFKKYGMDINYCINNEIGTSLRQGKEITIIEDTLTSGNSLKETVEKIKALTGELNVNIIVSVDRMERGNHLAKTARYELEKEYGVRIYSIVTIEDIINAMQSGVIGAEHLRAMMRYKEEYGGC